ncbi:MAG: hypothetical protein WC144_04870 [Sulfurimonas sp.]|jgi:hypothetical protein|nr:hypothetical protein [Sulfurimonadaceae bacterium]
MQTITLKVEDSKLVTVLNILDNLKENLIAKYEVGLSKKELEDFQKLANKSFEDIWDNSEDEIYDKYLVTC